MSVWFLRSAGVDELAALFGSFSIGSAGYAAVVAQIILIAAVTAGTSRHTVNQTLQTIE
jgi:cell division transport system permease protein